MEMLEGWGLGFTFHSFGFVCGKANGKLFVKIKRLCIKFQRKNKLMRFLLINFIYYLCLWIYVAKYYMLMLLLYALFDNIN